MPDGNLPIRQKTTKTKFLLDMALSKSSPTLTVEKIQIDPVHDSIKE